MNKKAIYSGPRPFICNVIPREQHRQVNVKTDNCYVVAAFSDGSLCAWSSARVEHFCPLSPRTT